MNFKTTAEAWAYSRRNKEDPSDPRCAGRQFEAMQLVEEYREKHESGDTTALPYALATCAHHGLVMPDWLADVVWHGTIRWHNFEAKTLDEALGVSRKGKRGPDELNYRKYRDVIFVRVLDRIKEGASIDQGLFDEVADEMNAGFSGPTCKRWLYRFVEEDPRAKEWFEHYKDPSNSPARRNNQP